MIPEHIKNFSAMCTDAIKIADEINLQPQHFEKVVVCGVGGSGVCGDLLVDLMRNTPVEVDTVKNYHLPTKVGKNTLIFCVSYSGDTEETLSMFVEARKLGCKTISITSGGRLKEWSEKFGSDTILVPRGLHQRDAMPYIFLPMVVCLKKLGMGNFQNDLQEILEVTKQIDLHSLDEIARKVKNSEIAIYGSDEFTGIVRRFKNEFNENAKMVVRHDTFPELNHNEINGYQRTELNGRADILFLRDADETNEIRIRFEVTKEILQDYVNSIYEIWPAGKSKLSKIISFAYIASYLTAKIAELVGINRERVVFVERLKDELKNRLNFVEKLESELKLDSKN